MIIGLYVIRDCETDAIGLLDSDQAIRAHHASTVMELI